MSYSAEGKDLSCRLCFNLMIYPATLPCKHDVCKRCLDLHIENNGFTCPFCRARLSNWLRKIKLNNANIVNSVLWETIQEKYPKEVEALKSGISDDTQLPLDANSPPTSIINQNLAKPGEIRKEFELFYKKIEEKSMLDRKTLDEKNLRLSEALIKMIEEDEKKEEAERQKQREEQLRADEELAKQLLKESELLSPEISIITTSSDTDVVAVTDGYSDTTGSSPFKDDTHLYKAVGDSPLFLGPCGSRKRTNTSVINFSPSPSRSPVTSTPKSSAIQDKAIRLDIPSTSKDDVFAKYVCIKPVASTSLSNNELSHFASVMPGPSTLDYGGAEQHADGSTSRSSSGTDSIAKELLYFKPIRSSPTTPLKDGRLNCWPQMVVAQKTGVGQELTTMADEGMSTPSEVMAALNNDPKCDLSAQDLEESMTLESQQEADRRLALEIQKQWEAEDAKNQRSVRTDYNLRKRRKGNLRKKVLIDRRQTTLDSMLIK